MKLKFGLYSWVAWVSPGKSSENLEAGENLFPLFFCFFDWPWAIALNSMWFLFTLGYTLCSENSHSSKNPTYCAEVFFGSWFFFSTTLIPRCFWNFLCTRLFLFLSCLLGSFHGLLKADESWYFLCPCGIHHSEGMLEYGNMFLPLSWWPLNFSEFKSFTILAE